MHRPPPTFPRSAAHEVPVCNRNRTGSRTFWLRARTCSTALSAVGLAARRRPGKFKRGQVWFPSYATSTTALRAAGLFFPLDIQLTLRAESYSPWVLKRLEWAGGNLEFFAKGAGAVDKMLELEISAAGLCAVTEKLGRERASLRDAEVETFHKGDFEPQYVEPPTVAAVAMNGGALHRRQLPAGFPTGASEGVPGSSEGARARAAVEGFQRGSTR